VTDSQGATDTQDITIVISGDNSAPEIAIEPGDSDAETLAETDTTLATTGTLSVTDINTTDEVTSALTQVISTGTTTGLQSDNATLLSMLSLNGNVIGGTTENGTLNWSFNSASEAFDYLASGESLILTYTVQVEDSQGATDTQAITITITGTNDAPVITINGTDSSGDSLGVTGATLTTDGTLSVGDLDRSDEVTAAVTGLNKSGDLTGLTLSDAQLQAFLDLNTSVISDTQQAGTIHWDFDSDGYTFGYLGANESITLVYTITVTDSQGATDTQNITIVINGVNSAPAISAEPGDSDAESLAETDSTLATSGTLSVLDINTTDTVTAEVSAVFASGTTTGLLSNNTALLNMLSVNASVIADTTETGTINWNFDSASEAFDYLATGESLTLTYTITATDSQGMTDTQDVTITITGTNDAPLITISDTDSIGDSLSVTGSTLSTDGTLSVADFDRSDVVTANITGFSRLGDDAGLALSNAQLEALLSINAAIINDANQSGSIHWDFDSDGYTFGYLGANESINLVYTITVTDSQGAADTQNITIVINGVNSAPAISVEPGDSDAESLAETDSTLATSGTLSVFDINTTDTVTADVSAVVASGTTAGLQANNVALLNMLSVNANVIADTAETGTITWNFDSAGEAFDYLAAGESLILTYTIEVEDSQSSTDTQAITITITGTNDAPMVSLVIDDRDSDMLVETNTTLTSGGTLTVSDLDLSDVVLAEVSSVVATGTTTGLLSNNAALLTMMQVNQNVINDNVGIGTLAWEFDSTNEAFQFLSVGESLVLTYTLTITDSQAVTASHQITITIQGTNDAPIAESMSLTATEDGVAFHGQLIGTDVDATDSLTFMLVDGPQEGSAVIDSDGTFSFDPEDGFQDLALGETRSVTFVYEVTDSHDAKSQATVTVTVSGTNDRPTVVIETGDQDSVVLVENWSPLAHSGTLTVFDIDRSDVVTAAVTGVTIGGTINGFTSVYSKTIAMFSVTELVIDSSSQAGTLLWSFDSGDEVFGHLVTGQSMNLQYQIAITDSSGLAVTHDVVIAIIGNNVAPIASGESITLRPGEVLSLSTPGLLSNDYDPDGDTIFLVIVDPPKYGTLIHNANGSISYTPNPGFLGVDTIRYQVTDGRTSSDVVVLSISLNADSPDSGATSQALIVTSEAINSQEPTDNQPVNDGMEITTSDQDYADGGSNQWSEGGSMSLFNVTTWNTFVRDTKLTATTSMNPGLDSINREYVTSNPITQSNAERMLMLRDALAGSVSTQSDVVIDDRSVVLMLGEAILSTASATLSAATAGTLFWILRGAAVVVTLASGMPALRSLDPANLLADYRAAKLTSDDEELEEMIKNTDDVNQDHKQPKVIK